MPPICRFHSCVFPNVVLIHASQLSFSFLRLPECCFDSCLPFVVFILASSRMLFWFMPPICRFHSCVFRNVVLIHASHLSFLRLPECCFDSCLPFVVFILVSSRMMFWFMPPICRFHSCIFPNVVLIHACHLLCSFLHLPECCFERRATRTAVVGGVKSSKCAPTSQFCVSKRVRTQLTDLLRNAPVFLIEISTKKWSYQVGVGTRWIESYIAHKVSWKGAERIIMWFPERICCR